MKTYDFVLITDDTHYTFTTTIAFSFCWQAKFIAASKPPIHSHRHENHSTVSLTHRHHKPDLHYSCTHTPTVDQPIHSQAFTIYILIIFFQLQWWLCTCATAPFVISVGQTIKWRAHKYIRHSWIRAVERYSNRNLYRLNDRTTAPLLPYND